MKQLLGIASLVFALIGFSPYIADILRRRTKPHAFSWLVWSVLAGIAFAVQISHNGGAGVWLMGLTAIVTLLIFGLSFRYGEKHILVGDWLSLLFATIALLLWFITNQPLLSVILISLIDVVGGFLPTFRKSLAHPHEETAVLYLMYAASTSLSVLALNNISLTNALYPATLAVVNVMMTSFLFIRQRSART